MDLTPDKISLTSRDVTIFGNSGRSEGSRGYQFVCMYYQFVLGNWELVYEGGSGAVDRSGVGSPPPPNAVKVKIISNQECLCTPESGVSFSQPGFEGEWGFGAGGYFWVRKDARHGDCTSHRDGQQYADQEKCPSKEQRDEFAEIFRFAGSDGSVEWPFNFNTGTDLDDLGDIFDSSNNNQRQIQERNELLQTMMNSMLMNKVVGLRCAKPPTGGYVGF